MKPATPEAYQLLHDGALALADMEDAGIRIDVDYLDNAITRASLWIEKTEERLKSDPLIKKWKRKFGRKFSFEASDQLGKLIYDDLGYIPRLFSEKGNPKATEEAFEKCGAMKDHPILEKYFKLKKLYKARSTYLYGFKREVCCGYIHASHNLAGGGGRDEKGGARSYRSSCDGPNLQNIPVRNKFIKSFVLPMFVARDADYHPVEWDFSQLEVCIAACYCKDPMLIKYINDKTKDMHRDMACEVYLLKPEQVSDDARYCAKNKFVFPAFYGQYYKQMAPALWEAIASMKLEMAGEKGGSLLDHLQKNGIKKLGKCKPDEDARPGTFEYHIKEVERRFWDDRFAVYAEWKRQWYAKYLERGWFRMKTGFLVEGYYKRNEVNNLAIQGSAFHCLLWCIIKMNKWLRKNKMKTVLTSEVHDSAKGDAHKDELQDVMGKMHEIMTVDLRKAWDWIIVPLSVKAKVAPAGGSWNDMVDWSFNGSKWGPVPKKD